MTRRYMIVYCVIKKNSPVRMLSPLGQLHTLSGWPSKRHCDRQPFSPQSETKTCQMYQGSELSNVIYIQKKINKQAVYMELSNL